MSATDLPSPTSPAVEMVSPTSPLSPQEEREPLTVAGDTQAIRVLITGGTGFLGSHLVHTFLSLPQHPATPAMQLAYTYNASKPLTIPNVYTHTANAIKLDLTKYDDVLAVIEFVQPHVIIHCAAQSQTAECEKHSKAAQAINRDGTHNITAAAIQTAITNKQTLVPSIIHISTDWVYGGDNAAKATEEDGLLTKTRVGKYTEDDEATGFNVYGKSKLAGEHAIRALVAQHTWFQPHYVILRSALMYGIAPALQPEKQCFLKFMFDTLQAQSRPTPGGTIPANSKPLELYSNEYRSPVYIDDVVTTIYYFVHHFTRKPQNGATIQPLQRNLYLMGGASDMSRYEMGKVLVKLLGLGAHTSLRSITLEQAKQVKLRPKDLTMDSTRLRELTGLKPRTFEQGLRSMIKRMLRQFEQIMVMQQRAVPHIKSPPALRNSRQQSASRADPNMVRLEQPTSPSEPLELYESALPATSSSSIAVASVKA